MSKNKFIGDKEKLSIIEEGIKADLSFFDNFNYFLGECIEIASLLGKYQFNHGVDLNNGFLVEEDLESFKRENNKTIAFIKEVITNNNLTNAYDQRIAHADNKIANIINEMIFKEGGIAHVNGLDNVYFSTECKDKASEYFACVYPTAAGSIPPDNRMTLDDYLKMEDLMPPNLRAAINQPKVNLENQQKLLQNLLNDATLTPEQKDQLNKQLSNISATLDKPNLKAIDLIYQNATWGKQLISEHYQKYGDLYLIIDTLWNAATFGIGLFTYGIGTAVMAGIDLFSAGYQYTMLNTTGRNLVTGEIATSAEYQAATFNLFAEGVSLGVGHLNNKINPAGKSIANQLSETKLGQRLMSSEAYRVYTHAKDQLGVAVKPVVNKIQQTIDDIKQGITKPIVGGLDKVEDFFGDVAKKIDNKSKGVVNKNATTIQLDIKNAKHNQHSSIINNPLYPNSISENQQYIELIAENGRYTKYKVDGDNKIYPLSNEGGFDHPRQSIDKILGLNKGGENASIKVFPKVEIAEVEKLEKLLKEYGVFPFPNGQHLELSKLDFDNATIIKTADHHILRRQFQYIPGEDKPIYIVLKQVSENSDQLRRISIYYEGNRAIDIELEDKLVHLQYWKKVVNPDTKVITVERIKSHYYDVGYLR